MRVNVIKQLLIYAVTIVFLILGLYFISLNYRPMISDKHFCNDMASLLDLEKTRLVQYRAYLSTAPTSISSCTRYSYSVLKESLQFQNKTVALLGYDPMDHFKDYDFEVQKRADSGGVVTFIVKELHLGAATEGGSSFRGVVHWNDRLFLCSYTDHFNGTYTIACPKYSRCAHVHLTLLHVAFNQFRSVTRRLDYVLLDTEVCTPEPTPCVPPANEYWHRNGTGPWKWHHGVDYPFEDEKMCEVLSSVGNLYLVGSSHMFYRYQYLSKTCTDHMHDLAHKLYYISADYMYNVRKIIQIFSDLKTYTWCKKTHAELRLFPEKLKQDGLSALLSVCTASSQHNISVMFQTGSWDLSYKKFDATLKLQSMDPALRSLSQFMKTSKFLRVLMLGPPPYFSHNRYATCRNDDMIQVFSHHLRKLSSAHQLEYLNVFDIVYPRFNESVHNDHYLACGPAGQCVGDVGKAVTQLALVKLLGDG